MSNRPRAPTIRGTGEDAFVGYTKKAKKLRTSSTRNECTAVVLADWRAESKADARRRAGVREISFHVLLVSRSPFFQIPQEMRAASHDPQSRACSVADERAATAALSVRWVRKLSGPSRPFSQGAAKELVIFPIGDTQGGIYVIVTA